MNRIHFTHSERTKKKYTVRDALKFAQAYLRDRGYATCANAVRKSMDTPITLVELNEISDEIIGDSFHYGVRL